MTRDSQETSKHGSREKPLAQSWSICSLGLFIGLYTVCCVEAAENPAVMPVWPGTVPGDYGVIGSERIRAPSEAPTKDAKWITNVTKPTVTIFRPAENRSVGTAVIICPGGGYWNLAWAWKAKKWRPG